MRDGTVAKTFDIQGIKAEIREFMDLKFLVVYGFNEAVEKTADEEKVDAIKVKGYEEQPANTYFHKPTKLGYYKKLPELIEDIGLKKEKRKGIRKLTEIGVNIEAERPINEETFREWLQLYNETADSRKNDLRRAEWFKKNRKRLVGLFAYLDDSMLGGIIIMLKEENSEKLANAAVRATKKEYAEEGLNDFLTYHFIVWAIKNGFKTIKSGTDTNFYGYHLSPELFLFRREWGFEPKPGKELEWIRFLNFEKMQDVCFFISGKESPQCNLILKKDIEEKEEKRFTIPDYGFKKFKIFDNSLIHRYV